VRGELLQIDNRNRLDLSGRLFSDHPAETAAFARRVAARPKLAGAATAVRRLETFGMSLGRAFQIQDDILDIVGDAGTVARRWD